jgi:DNA polymerase I
MMVPYLVRPERMRALAELAQSWQAVVLDCETTGLEIYLDDRLLGFSVGDLHGEDCYYIPYGHKDAENVSAAAVKEFLELLAGRPVLGYNLKFDLHCLAHTYGEHFEASPMFDILVQARLMSIMERPALDLESVAGREIGFEYKSPAAGHQSEYGKVKATGEPYWSVSDIGTKCCEDVEATRRLYLHYKGRMPERLLRLFLLECRLTQRLYQMERRGVEYDPVVVERLDEIFGDLKATTQDRLRATTGVEDFNPNSNPQVTVVMAELGIDSPVKSEKTQKPSWSREILTELDHPVALGISQYRAFEHEKSNVVALLKRHIKAGQPILRGKYQNWGTVTGRLSSSGPNLQGMAKGWLQLGEVGEEGEPLHWSEEGPDKTISIRSIFIPGAGYEFIEFDYRQIEMFVAGYYFRDPNFQALLEQEDFHRATSLWVWGSDGIEERKRAKVFNFGLLYGIGLKSLAKRLGTTVKVAEGYRNQYFQKLGPGYRSCMYKIRSLLEDVGYVENVYGRRYYLSPDTAYIGFNYLCQGGAGDFVKFRQLAIEELCQGEGVLPTFTTHDDIVVRAPLGWHRSEACHQLAAILEDGNPFKMRLPVKMRVSAVNLVELQEVQFATAT